MHKLSTYPSTPNAQLAGEVAPLIEALDDLLAPSRRVGLRETSHYDDRGREDAYELGFAYEVAMTDKALDALRRIEERLPQLDTRVSLRILAAHGLRNLPPPAAGCVLVEVAVVRFGRLEAARDWTPDRLVNAVARLSASQA